MWQYFHWFISRYHGLKFCINVTGWVAINCAVSFSFHAIGVFHLGSEHIYMPPSMMSQIYGETAILKILYCENPAIYNCTSILYSVLWVLTHLTLGPLICVIKLGCLWFRQWLVACSAPSRYLKHCSIINNWTPRIKLQWHFNQN